MDERPKFSEHSFRGALKQRLRILLANLKGIVLTDNEGAITPNPIVNVQPGDSKSPNLNLNIQVLKPNENVSCPSPSDSCQNHQLKFRIDQRDLCDSDDLFQMFRTCSSLQNQENLIILDPESPPIADLCSLVLTQCAKKTPKIFDFVRWGGRVYNCKDLEDGFQKISCLTPLKSITSENHFITELFLSLAPKSLKVGVDGETTVLYLNCEGSRLPTDLSKLKLYPRGFDALGIIMRPMYSPPQLELFLFANHDHLPTLETQLKLVFFINDLRDSGDSLREEAIGLMGENPKRQSA